MDGDLFSGLKEFKCPRCGAVLGLVKRFHVERPGSRAHVSRLLLFRQAVDRSAEVPESVDVIAVVEGNTLDIRCSVPGCNAVRSWHKGEDALERFKETIGGGNEVKGR